MYDSAQRATLVFNVVRSTLSKHSRARTRSYDADNPRAERAIKLVHSNNVQGGRLDTTTGCRWIRAV